MDRFDPKIALEELTEEATLPHPVTSAQVNLLAESILRTAQEGERNAVTLQRMALLELQLTPHD